MRPNPRETMRVLPRFIQPLLTDVTGVPLDDERPLYQATPWTRLLTSSAVTAAGLILGLIALSHPWIDERFVPSPFVALGLLALLAGWIAGAATADRDRHRASPGGPARSSAGPPP